MPINTLTRGQLARRSGVHPETIRYYERLGLLEAPARSAHGARKYPPHTVATLQTIRRARLLGFPLPEIRALVSGKGSRGELKRALQGLDARDEALRALRALRHAVPSRAEPASALRRS